MPIGQMKAEMIVLYRLQARQEAERLALRQKQEEELRLKEEERMRRDAELSAKRQEFIEKTRLLRQTVNAPNDENRPSKRKVTKSQNI